jgi:hypothetical protein
MGFLTGFVSGILFVGCALLLAALFALKKIKPGTNALQSKTLTNFGDYSPVTDFSQSRKSTNRTKNSPNMPKSCRHKSTIQLHRMYDLFFRGDFHKP